MTTLGGPADPDESIVPRIASSLGLDRSPAKRLCLRSASSPYLQLQQLRAISQVQEPTLFASAR
jgi:hypothetical protein